MKIKNRDRLDRKLKAIPKVVRSEISKAIAAGADEVVAAQKAAVPKDKGDLERSTKWQWGGRGEFARRLSDDQLSAVITSGGTPETRREIRKGSGEFVDNAIMQEFGTRKMSANPYFFPAYRLLRRRSRSRITRGINKGIKKVVGS